MSLKLIFYLFATYILGAIPTGYIVGYIFKGIDIRNYGSKNIGFTNVLRVLGTWPAVIVLIIDIAKGFIPVFLCRFVLNEVTDVVIILIGTIAIVGHNWTIFLNFNGGKGVNTSLGVWLAIVPEIMLVILLIWALVIYFTRYMSLSNIIATVLLVILVIIYHNNSLSIVIFSVITSLLVIYRHKANIERLIKGQETKIGEKVEIDIENK
ncbi:MAG: glycerol-3-phosphate 1-O-acyltransferase PlsY [Candidatus Firestonebacteria bacterium]|nr:glycerol-3-phosphate 1-O-acyltransferase PlsY [Candidatus Firestonebacteria bacterium]